MNNSAISVRLIVTAVFSTLALAQPQQPAGQTVQVAFSPVPFWVKGGPPADLADRYFVYFDYQQQEYVISFPESLQSGRREDTRRTEFRLEPQNKVEPEVSVTIARTQDGHYAYSYRLTSRSSSKQPIRWLMLVAASDDDSLILRHAAWAAYVSPTPDVAPQGALKGGPELKIRANVGKFASWNNVAGEPLLPGGTVTGLEAVSTFLPGITTAYATSGVAPRIPVALPPQVSDQLAPLLKIENNSKVTATIGPKFNRLSGPAADPVWIADDYGQAIASLVESGRLQENSPFIIELNAILNSIIETGARRAIQFKAQPATSFENEIANAVKLALGLE